MNNQWRDNANKTVIWGDGSYDWSRSCEFCDDLSCSKPIHGNVTSDGDGYGEIGQTRLEESESEDHALSYWDWMHSTRPLGGRLDHDGDLITPELNAANPDNLIETGLKNSGVSGQQHIWMSEAFATLTPLQQKVWTAVQREQRSQVELANELGISRQAVSQALSASITKVTDYLRERSL